MPTLLELALDHAAFRRRLGLSVAREAATMWAKSDLANLSRSWLEALPRLLVLVAGAQQAAAGLAQRYVSQVMSVQGLDAEADGEVPAASFSGVASDGRGLDGLLYQPVVTTLTGIQRGLAPAQAFAGGGATLDMMVRTQIADAGRAADQVATVAHPRASGYVRMLVGRSCSRCAVLAGRWYASNAGFNRHPRCRPGATASTSRAARTPPGTRAPTRRRSSPA